MNAEVNHIATWFIMPVKDMERAKAFYADVMQTGFEDNDMEGMKMAIFNHADTAVSGMLMQAEGYEPTNTGAVVYLNGGKDLNEPLERAVQAGGSVITPKTAIDEGKNGYCAQFIDSEGNRVGLYSSPENN